MKKLLALVLLLVVSFSAFAEEKKVSFDGAIELGLPVGDFADASGFGAGVSVKGYYPMNDKLDLTGRVGYSYFSGEEINAGFFKVTTDYGMIPLMFGAKYKAIETMPEFYVSGELGMNFLMLSVEMEAMGFGSSDESETESYFTFTPSVGYVITSGNHKFDLNASYRMVDMGDLNYIGLRVGYYLPF